VHGKKSKRVGPFCRLFPKLIETMAYFNLELPPGPAMMVADAIVFKGADIPQHGSEAFSCGRPGFLEPEKERKDPLGRIPERWKRGPT
jgi:hypothetical protein